jgi:hypothetical protein
MMRCYASASVAKELESPLTNEDYFRSSDASQRWVLSDGASESFAAKSWARIVSYLYLLRGELNPSWIDKAITLYERRFNPSQMSWSQLGAFERGSFATLLGTAFDSNRNVLRVTAVGDSVAFLFSYDDGLVESFPYRHPHEFEQRPLLLSTKPEANQSIIAHPTSFCRNWHIPPDARQFVILASDAVAAWLLTAPKERVYQLVEACEQDRFTQLVKKERESGHLRRDDCTVVALAH